MWYKDDYDENELEFEDDEVELARGYDYEEDEYDDLIDEDELELDYGERPNYDDYTFDEFQD